ncbi:MAG: TraR/DksA family transcriptional regulator [Candidatus Latescibacteria bacterium]|jgi:DnaK suppressor protein|nr:TraR/DksA family transcriptional regulator [Candidatus Latescibacterota bacterium]
MAKHRPLSKKKLEFYKKLLIERKRELLKQVLNQDEDIDEIRGDVAADPLDAAGNSSSLELMTTLGNHERRELAEIDHALQKIEDRSYGFCEESEEPIHPARLEAVPTARYTMEVQERLERTPLQFDRPRRRVLMSEDLPMSTDDDE